MIVRSVGSNSAGREPTIGLSGALRLTFSVLSKDSEIIEKTTCELKKRGILISNISQT